MQAELRRILPGDCILVGQSLNSDLNALKMMHPYVIDTSVIFNITGERWVGMTDSLMFIRFLANLLYIIENKSKDYIM